MSKEEHIPIYEEPRADIIKKRIKRGERIQRQFNERAYNYADLQAIMLTLAGGVPAPGHYPLPRGRL